MLEVVLTAIGVGLATVAGAGIGFLFRNISHKLSDYILGFSAGIMLCASVVGLILPSLDFGGTYGIITTILGILSGAIFLNLMYKFIPHDHVCYAENKTCEESARKTKIMLFVFAIGLHNFPEGIASGVGFGTGEMGRAIMISIGIALQNIPEGMVIIVPMLSLGFKKSKVFLIALITGLIEVVGAFIGYFLS